MSHDQYDMSTALFCPGHDERFKSGETECKLFRSFHSDLPINRENVIAPGCGVWIALGLAPLFASVSHAQVTSQFDSRGRYFRF